MRYRLHILRRPLPARREEATLRDMMKQTLILLMTMVLLGLTGNRSLGEDTAAARVELPATGGHMAQFYTNKADHTGRFPGKLVCAYDTLPAIPASTEECSGDHRVYALEVDNGKVVHPLIADTKQMVDRVWFEDLRDKPVIVVGRYNPDTGQILVENIQAKPEAITSLPAKSTQSKTPTYTW